MTSPAHTDIRRAEASRVLGILESEALPERALGWLDAGVDTQNVRALAGAANDETIPDGVRLALVAEIAAELGLGFATVQEARALQAEQLIRSINAGEDVAPQIFNLSNTVTDEFSERIRRAVAKIFRRR